MANYKVKYHFTDGSELNTFPGNKSEDIIDMIHELTQSRYQCGINPDGSVDLVDMTQVCHVRLEKEEG